MNEIIRIPLPTPFSIGDVYAYLIVDDPVTLIDTGLSYPASWDALRQGLQAHGLQPSDVKRVLLTHGHLDHFGQAGRFLELGAAVHMHPLEVGKVQTPDWWLARRDEVLHACGTPPAALDVMAGVWEQGRQMTLPLPAFVPLVAGEVLGFASAPALTVVPLPGHSLGHVGFLQGAEHGGPRVLVGGDHLLSGVSPNPILEPLEGGGRAPTLAQFLDSLTVVEGLSLRRVLPGHGPEIDSHRVIAADYRRRHEGRLSSYARLVSAQGMTAWELTQQVFPRVREWNVFLALSEVLAHLDYLVADGRLVRETGPDGVERYRPGVPGSNPGPSVEPTEEVFR